MARTTRSRSERQESQQSTVVVSQNDLSVPQNKLNFVTEF